MNIFPAFEQFVAAEKVLARQSGGDLSVKITRILGKGKTKAIGFRSDTPPSLFERKVELANLELDRVATAGIKIPDAVVKEVQKAKLDVEEMRSKLLAPDGWQRMAKQVQDELPHGVKGFQDNYFYVNDCLLLFDKKSVTWAWCFTPHYKLVSKLPCDVAYLISGFQSAEEMLKEVTCAPEDFLMKLDLSWLLAAHFTPGDSVLLIDVARMFKVASQSEKFWKEPKKQYFKDVADGAFVANIAKAREMIRDRYGLVPATIHQAQGKSAKAFFLPANAAGTRASPYIQIKRRSS